MFNIDEFLKVAVPQEDSKSKWYERAADGVSHLVRNASSNEIILCSNVGQSLVHSVLAPLSNVTPADGDDLLRAHVWADSHWAFGHVSGGGEPDRMYLSDPLNSPGCNSLVGGEQLVFRRSFTGVDKGKVRTSISQRLEQALDLYWLEEESAYCRLNEDGDVEPVVHLRDMSKHTGSQHDVLVTIEAHQLHRYMAVTETALVMKFDYTRVQSGFMGWHGPARAEVKENDLFYSGGIQTGCSFVNGIYILRPLLTKEMLIAHSQREWSDEGKQYATFKAHDWKNDRLAEISCAPSALASYFEKDSPLPFQITPAFFKPEVLQRYKADLDKYRLEYRSITSRAGWNLKTYDVNEAGQVHTYLHYLGSLPYSEQQYWQSFNEWPKADISKRSFETDIEGNFSTVPDPLVELKYELSELDTLAPDYWQPRGEHLARALHYPLTASTEEWANAILALDQLVVEGFATKPLRQRARAAGGSIDKQWGTIRLLQECLAASGMDEDVVAELLEPLRQTHHLRSKVKGHAAEAEKTDLVKRAKIEHGSLPAHFRALLVAVKTSVARLVELL